MKILGFAGSNSSKSINRRLVNFTLTYFSDEETEMIDLNDYEMPIYSSDREENNGIPDKARSLASLIDKSDLLVLSLAEHNGAYSAAFKNIYDWMSRIKGRSVLGEKPMFLLAASTGKRGGASVLEIAEKRFTFQGTKVITTFSLPLFNENFNDQKGITDPVLLSNFEEKLIFVKEMFRKGQ